MTITKINILPVRNRRRLRAYVAIELDKSLSITDIRLFQKDDHTYYLDFPATEKARLINDSNIFLTAELRRITTDAVIDEYNKSIQKENDNHAKGN